MTDQTEGSPTHDGAALSAQERAGIADRLLSRLTQVTAPRLRDAVVAAEADPSQDPLPGDLWRVAWDTTTLLVLVVGLNESEPAVAPISLDPPAGDERTMVLPADSHILGVPAAAWVGLTHTVPLRVFDARLGRIQPHFLATARSILGDGEPSEQGEVATGEPITSPFSQQAGVRADLEDGLERLVAATWAPPKTTPTQSIPDLLTGRADLEDLQQALGATPGHAWQLWCGERAIEPDEAETLGQRFGVSADALLATASLPGDLVAELDRPAWRPELRIRKAALHLDDRRVRLEAAYGCLVPARTTGAGPGQWIQLLRQYFDTHPVPEDQR
jgi:hypothetical protein